MLYVHLSEAAVGRRRRRIGRVENTRSVVIAEQVREWCGHPDTEVIVKPVIDLADHVHVESYETPDRLTEHTGLRDGTCVFPWCTRPARSCDSDHVIPHSRGGPTCSETSLPCAGDITG